MKNSDVIKNWLTGQSGSNPNYSLSTDGETLYSYKLAIGRTKFPNDNIRRWNNEYSTKELFLYTAGDFGIEFFSQTTSTHVNLAYNIFTEKCYQAPTLDELRNCDFTPSNLHKYTSFVDGELFESRMYPNVRLNVLHGRTDGIIQLDRANRFGGIKYGVLDAVGVN